MAITKPLLVLLGSLAYGGFAVVLTSRTSLQSQKAALPQSTSLAVPVTVQRNPLRKPFTWEKNPKYRPFTAEVSTTRTEAMFGPRDTHKTTEPPAENLLTSRTMFDREPLATSEAANFRVKVPGEARPCKSCKKPCKTCKTPCKSCKQMPISPHKRQWNLVDEDSDVVESTNTKRFEATSRPSRTLVTRRTAAVETPTAEVAEAEATATPTIIHAVLQALVPLPTEAAPAVCAGGRCGYLQAPGSNSASESGEGSAAVFFDKPISVRNITLPTLNVLLDFSGGDGTAVVSHLVARGEAPAGSVAARAAVPAFSPPSRFKAPAAFKAPVTFQSRLLKASRASPQASAATPSVASEAVAEDAAGTLQLERKTMAVVPRRKTTTTMTTTTTTTTTTTVTAVNKPLSPPLPKPIACTTCCTTGCCGVRCPSVRAPRLAARSLEPAAPFASSSSAHSPSSSSSKLAPLHRLRASSDASPADSSLVAATLPVSRRTTTITSTTRITTTTTIAPTATDTTKTTTTETATTTVRTPPPTSMGGAAGLVRADVGLVALLGGFWIAVVA